MEKFDKFLVIIFLILFTTGCAQTLTIKDYQIGPIESYNSFSKTSNLAIAIQPISTSKEKEDYFGTDLGELDILPIFVAIENRSSSSVYLVDKNEISFGFVEQKKEFEGESVGEAVAGAAIVGSLFTPLILAPLAPFAIIGGTKAISDNSIIKHKFLTSSLMKNSLPPGNKVYGFIFFNTSKAVGHESSRLALNIRLKDLGSGEYESIILKINN